MKSVTCRHCLSCLVFVALAACAGGYRASPQQQLHAECLERHENEARIYPPGSISLACQRWAAKVAERASLLRKGGLRDGP